MSVFKRGRLCGAVLLATTALSTGALAQAVAVDAQVGEVIVTARRPLAESSTAALQIQRNSDSLVSVISADAAGVLPD